MRYLAGIFLFLNLISGVIPAKPAFMDSPPEGLIYLSPLPGSKGHNPETGLIIRFNGDYVTAVIEDLSMKVYTEDYNQPIAIKKYFLDINTLLIKPQKAFEYGTEVFVEILLPDRGDSYTYSFQIREQPLKNLPRGDPAENFFADNSLQKNSFRNNLPPDFPEVTISNSENPSDAYVFLGIKTTGPGKSTYLCILDTTGFPVYYKKFENATADFKLQENGYLSYYNASVNKFFELDSAYQVRRILGAGNAYYTDMHELLIQEDDSFWIMGMDPQLIDMSQIVSGGNPNATVMGYVIQKLNPAGNVLFQWRTLDHIPVTDTDTNFVDLTGSYVDYIHCNALSLDGDGNILLSSRHTNEITKINITDGSIIWRMGGNANEFSFQNDPRGFKGQHSIRFNKGNSYTLFNNANFLTPVYSSGNEYQINPGNMTVTLLHEFISGDPLIYADAMGHTQRLPNGNTVCGWAVNENLIVMTEFDSSGNKVFEMSNPDSSMASYRAFKFEWETNIFLFDKDSVYFGEEVLIGDSADQILQITNNLGKATIINHHHLNKPGFELITSLPKVFQVGETREFKLRFKPVDEKIYVDALSLYYQDDKSRIAKQIKLSGGGILAGKENEWIAESKLSVRPNPARENILISIAAEKPSMLHIYDASGKMMLGVPMKTRQIQINTSSWRKGLYYLRLQNDDSVYSRKLIIH